MYGKSVAVLKKADYISPIIQNIVKERKYKIYDFKFTDSCAEYEEKGYKGETRRAILTGVKVSNEKETLKLVVKSANPENVKSEIFCKCEVYVYLEIHPALLKIQNESNIPENKKIQFVQCYGTSLEPKKQGLILKDLSDDGYKIYKDESLDFDHLIIVLKNMATLHALGFAATEKLPAKKLLEMRGHVLSKKDHDLKFYSDLQQYVRTAAAIMDSENNVSTLKKYYNCSVEEFAKRIDGYIDFDKDFMPPYATLTHGDFWINNFLFKYKDEKPENMCLLDWQKVRFASPIIDLSYLVYFCLDEDTREQHWEEILTTYYDTLKNKLKELNCNVRQCYPEAVFRTELSKKLSYGMLMSMMLLPLRFKGTIIEWDKKTMTLKNIAYSDDCKTRLNEIVRHLSNMNNGMVELEKELCNNLILGRSKPDSQK